MKTIVAKARGGITQIKTIYSRSKALSINRVILLSNLKVEATDCQFTFDRAVAIVRNRYTQKICTCFRMHHIDKKL